MKAADLRLGNIIQDPITGEALKIDAEKLAWLSKNEVNDFSLFPYTGARITKNVLHLFKLQREDGEFYFDCGGIRVFIIVDEGNRYVNDGMAVFTGGPDDTRKIVSWYAVECRYIHQLQNLYKALKGEEL